MTCIRKVINAIINSGNKVKFNKNIYYRSNVKVKRHTKSNTSTGHPITYSYQATSTSDHLSFSYCMDRHTHTQTEPKRIPRFAISLARRVNLSN